MGYQNLLCTLTILLLVSTALAQDDVISEEKQGFFSKILSAIKSLINKILGKSATEPADDRIVCETPYIRVGVECCLDSDENLICDKDEASTSTVAPTTSTTLLTTSTIVTTTSIAETTTTIACELNADCGNVTTERRCLAGSVYEQTMSPVCRSPGKPDAQCILRSSKLEYAIEKCAGSCIDGECVWV